MSRKKRIVCAGILLAALLMNAVLGGCSRHRITVISGEQNVYECPRHAKTGETVTVMTAMVTDGELYVNGVEGEFVRPGEFRFVMPDRDVELKVTVIAFPDGA